MRVPIMLPLLLALPFAAGQTSPAPQPATPVTIHAQARLVAVDVVVLDKDHHPVHDLKQQDFAVFENNQPQSINSFAEFKVIEG